MSRVSIAYGEGASRSRPHTKSAPQLTAGSAQKVTAAPLMSVASTLTDGRPDGATTSLHCPTGTLTHQSV